MKESVLCFLNKIHLAEVSCACTQLFFFLFFSLFKLCPSSKGEEEQNIIKIKVIHWERMFTYGLLVTHFVGKKTKVDVLFSCDRRTKKKHVHRGEKRRKVFNDEKNRIKLGFCLIERMSLNDDQQQKYSGIMLKKIHVADLGEKYGQGQRGLVADEYIRKGELILQNDPDTSMFYPFDDERCSHTMEEFWRLVNEQNDEKVKEYLLRYSLPYTKKNVFVPRNYLTRHTIDLSALLNHSCEANCTSTYTDHVIAIEDIQPGTILTVDYGIGITGDNQLKPFDQCRCGTSSCAGKDALERYKTPQWQEKFYQYTFPYVKERIDQLRKQS